MQQIQMTAEAYLVGEYLRRCPNFISKCHTEVCDTVGDGSRDSSGNHGSSSHAIHIPVDGVTITRSGVAMDIQNG